MSAPPEEYANPPVLVIRPDSARTLGLAGDLWAFRDLLWSLADRDLRLRYRQTVLGIAWVVLQPLLGALILTFVFGVVAGLSSDGVPYFRFTFASLAGWGLFAGILTRASGSLVQNAGLIGKVWFPRVVLPASVVPAALLDFVVAAVIVLTMAAADGALGPGAILAPVWALAIAALAFGLGLIFAALMVSYRDVQHVLPVAMQLLLYASPVAYAASNIPEAWRGIFLLNPIATYLEGLRSALLGTPTPATRATVGAVAVTAAVLVAGHALFRRLERRFADVI